MNDIQEVTQESLRNLDIGDRKKILRKRKNWIEEQRLQDKRELKNLQTKIYNFKNPEKIKEYKRIYYEKKYKKEMNKMKDLDTKLINLYEEWLMSEHPEDVTNEDDLLKASETGLYIEDFVKEVIVHLNCWTKDFLEFSLKKIESEFSKETNHSEERK